jgi:Lon protease-like protein
MDAQLLPLFPLSLVLLPAMPLPLHIFEERYREMMADVMPAGSEFGVVFAKDDGIVNIGCTATVEQVLRRYPDGRLDLLAVGQRRFQINGLDQEKSYLRAEVEFFNDEDATDVSAELRQRAIAAYRTLSSLENEALADMKLEPARMSFQLGQLIDDFDKRQTILSLRSEVERLEYLVQVVPEYIVQRKRSALAKRVAPLNGHAKAAL